MLSENYMSVPDKSASITEKGSATACCTVHGASAHAWFADVPVADIKGFWGAFGCSCWMA